MSWLDDLGMQRPDYRAILRSDRHFRSDRPDWIEEATRIINEGLKARKRPEILLTEDQRAELELILGRYVAERDAWDGFPTAEQARPISNIAKASKDLQAALARARKTEMLWCVELELGVQGPEILAAFEGVLASLGKLEARSPRIDTKRDSHKTRMSPSGRMLRARLQGDLDRWWKATTRLSSKADERDSPYMKLLEVVFRRMKVAHRPGATPTAVKQARRDLRDLEAEATRKEERIVALGKLLEQARQYEATARPSDPEVSDPDQTGGS